MGVKLVSVSGGSVEINPPATASNFTATMPAGTGNVVVNGVNGALVSGTAVASTSGTSIDFTGIPSWVKRITVMFSGVSTNGISGILVQLGDGGGIENSGYVSFSNVVATASTVSAYTTGFGLDSGAATNNLSGSVILGNLDANTWVAQGNFSRQGSNAGVYTSGSKTLSDTLDRIRITTVNGTDTFDAGSINILYE